MTLVQRRRLPKERDSADPKEHSYSPVVDRFLQRFKGA